MLMPAPLRVLVMMDSGSSEVLPVAEVEFAENAEISWLRLFGEVALLALESDDEGAA